MEKLEEFISKFKELYPKEQFSPIMEDWRGYWVMAKTNYYDLSLENEIIVLEVDGVKTKHPNLTPEMAGTVLDALLTESWKY